tara:strand:+ start:319 stop:1083 length:765 start_codon:yes stop_codon:yes gene_type:complete
MNILENKVIVVTGSSGMIGSSFIKEIEKAGAQVIATDINIELLRDKYPNKNSINIDPFFMDITDKLSIDALIKTVLEKYGKIDAVINNAYPRNNTYGNKLEDVSYESFCENTSMHLGGYFLVSQRFCQYFKEKKAGNVINMSSVYGVIPPKFEIYKGTQMTTPIEYAAIKSAIIHITKYFTKYYKNDGIRFNSISPGGILDLQPESFIEAYNKNCSTKGMLDVSDLSGALLFLLSDASKAINGHNLVVDDSFSL